MTRNKQEAVRGDAAPRQRPKQPLFVPPVTISNETFWVDGRDDWLRETLYLMVLCLNQLHTFREAFGRAMDLTSPQFAVLMGTAYTQGAEGVSIGTLATHVHLAPTHVTTEVGRLIRLGLLQKRPNNEDRRSVLVRLSPRGEKAIRAVVPLRAFGQRSAFRQCDARRITVDFAILSALRDQQRNCLDPDQFDEETSKTAKHQHAGLISARRQMLALGLGRRALLPHFFHRDAADTRIQPAACRETEDQGDLIG